MRIKVALFSALVCASCSSLPSTEKVSTFGSAAADTAAVLRAAVATNQTIGLRVGEEKEASKFLQKKPYTLADTSGPILRKSSLSAQLAALAALQDYGKALAKAADQGVIDSLEQASTKLGASVGNLAATAFPTYAPVIGPVVKIASEGAGWLVGNRYAAEIHSIILARNEDVKRLAALLKRDMPQIIQDLSLEADDFEGRRQASLDRVQDDEKVTRLELYHEFKAARQDTSAVRALVTAAGGYKDLLDSLVAAHDALAKDDPDAAVIIARFQILSTDVAALVTALRAEKQS